MTSGPPDRDRLIAAIGAGVVRFQESTAAFDGLAAQVLGVARDDLPCLAMLLFGGPASAAELMRRLRQSRREVTTAADRLQRAGYVRRRGGRGPSRLELTEHARRWIARIWEPLQLDGARLMASYSTGQLAMVHAFMTRIGDVQDRQARRLRRWLLDPPARSGGPHLRGGLSPAALRRVQLFVEAHLERPMTVRDLAARAGLSPYYFTRAFKATAGVTPRAFVEQRRLERARALIDGTDRPLADIALACGFKTQSHLTVAFRRQTGFTPAAYRRGGPRARTATRR